MTIPTISTLPVAPARTDAPATFVTRADAFLAALVVMQGELNTSIGAMNTDIAQANADAISASASATAAAGSAAAAAATAGATYWVSGQAYDSGDVAVSLIDNQTYRANTSTSGTTDPSASADWTQISYALPDQSGNSGSFLTTDGTSASWAEVSASPSLDAIASGTLTDGATVIINADGTVSTVVQSAGPPALGDVTAYDGFNITQGPVGIYDSVNQKVVLAWVDFASDVRAVVGEISGNTVTFGSAVVAFTGTANFPSIAYRASDQKVIIAYENSGSSDDGEAIVGQVSGTSINFGSSVKFDTGNTGYQELIYNPSADLLELYYRDGANNFYGTVKYGVISSFSTSWGSKVVFASHNSAFYKATFDSSVNKTILVWRNLSSGDVHIMRVTNTGGNLSFDGLAIFSGSSQYNVHAITYDSANQKTVTVVLDGSNSNRPTAIVCESTNPITVGSPVVIDNINIQYIESGLSYDSVNEKVIATYIETSSNNVYSAVGTVSGMSISFGTPILLAASTSVAMENVYDPDEDRTLILYGPVRSRVLQTQSVETTLTSENYIGISDGNYSDSETAKIQIVGSVDDAQSGLTAGQSYYVQADGSLGLTPLDVDQGLPSVFAGTAVSATKLIIKG